MIPLVTPETIIGRMEEFGTARLAQKNRIEVRTVPEKLHDAIVSSQAMPGFDRLVTISTVDNGRTFELFYHLIGPHRIVMSLAVELPRGQATVPTVSDILPPAGIYERQIHDLFGIMFDGHPGLKKIILNEDWPDNEHPLRKDWKPVPGAFYGGINGER